ncbi:hypothetical protein [Salarchaeum japonicum]
MRRCVSKSACDDEFVSGGACRGGDEAVAGGHPFAVSHQLILQPSRL